MAFQVIVVITGIVVGWIRKGSLWALPNIRLNWIWLLPVGYILQHVSIRYLTGRWYEVIAVFSYVTLMAFCAMNLKVPGVLWTFVGTAANFLVMMVNGLRMPAYARAVQRLDPSSIAHLKVGQGKSILMTSHTHLNFLGDIFTFNIWPQSIISVGDVLFAIGFVVVIQHAMRTEGGSATRVRRTENSAG